MADREGVDAASTPTPTKERLSYVFILWVRAGLF